MTDRDALIEHSKCKDCKHLVSRIVIPIDYEEFGVTIEELQAELDDDDYDENNEQIALVHNTCTILNMDLGHVVVDCNKYSKEGAPNFFKRDPYKLG